MNTLDLSNLIISPFEFCTRNSNVYLKVPKFVVLKDFDVKINVKINILQIKDVFINKNTIQVTFLDKRKIYINLDNLDTITKQDKLRYVFIDIKKGINLCVQ